MGGHRDRFFTLWILLSSVSFMKKLLDSREKDCPRCWVKMEKEKLKVFGPNIEVDVCPKCSGTWFDPGELSRAIGKKLGDYLTKRIGTKTESQLVCPRCGGLMDLEYAEEVEVDSCIECGGAWLDPGELEKLKEKSIKGYKGDKLAKAEELFEEHRRKKR